MALVPYNKNNIRISITKFGETIRVRIDDVENITRWEELSIPIAELLELLNHGTPA